jgi:hypothetical protein
VESVTEEKIETVPAKTPGPSGLDGVEISGCAFTESVGKKEPRPPLFRFLNSSHVFLKVNGGKVVVAEGDLFPPFRWAPGTEPRLGDFYALPPYGPAYTGPITPAMWAIIRKWWNP